MLPERLFECRIEHSEQVTAAERAAVADMSEVGAGVGAVHDHHGDAGLKGMEGVDVFGGAPFFQLFIGLLGGVVGGEAIGNLPVVAEIVQVVEYGEAGVPESSADGADLADSGVGEAGLLLDQLVGASGQHDWDMVGYAKADVSFQEFRGSVDGAHVRVEVCRLKSHSSGAVELCGHFQGDLIGAGVPDNIDDVGPKAAGAVGEAGDVAATGEGDPAIGIPFGGKGEVEAGVDVGVGLQPLEEAGDPGTGHHDAYGGGCAFC